MYGVTVHFERFNEVSFGDVLCATGVYVIWDSQARAKPSYIGKGDILSRLSSHDEKFASPVKGYIALIGNSGRKVESREAEIVEALLLEVARDTDRWPRHNDKSGAVSLLRRIAERKNQVRVTIKGCDPFGPPHLPRHLVGSKNIWFWLDEFGKGKIDHNWNYRKRIQR
jgi:hypothetical protein